MGFCSAATVGAPIAKKRRHIPTTPRGRTTLSGPSLATAFVQASEARLPEFVIGRAVAPIPEILTERPPDHF